LIGVRKMGYWSGVKVLVNGGASFIK